MQIILSREATKSTNGREDVVDTQNSLSLSLSLSKALLLAKAQTHAHKKKPALLLLLLKLSPKSGTLSDKKVFNRCFSLDGHERIALFFLLGV